jgi:hypothetical protein
LSASLRCEIDALELQDIARPLMGFGWGNALFGEKGREREEGPIEPERGMGLDTKWISS